MEQLPSEVEAFIEANYGDKAKQIVNALDAMGRATDNDLSELLEERPSHIRKVLYELYEARLANYEEHREPGTGWLTFVWTLTPEQGQRAYQESKQSQLEAIRSQIEYEQTHDFYLCPDGHDRHEFNEAMGHEFRCPECNAMLEHDESKAHLSELHEQLQHLQQGLAEA